MSPLTQLWRGIRAVVRVVAVTLVFLVVGLEGGYQAFQAARVFFWGKRDFFQSADHPFWHEQWYAGWQRYLGQLTRASVYDPYRGWRLPPVSVPGLHINTDGIRLTVHRKETELPAPRRVFMLGGSTMWGYSARDEHTIPSLVADRIVDRGITDVEVVNLACLAYNVTQGATTLLLELRRGNLPNAVVSLDGVNEVGVVYEGGRPGEVYEQDRAERQFDHSSFWRGLARLRYYSRGTTLAEAMVLHSLGLTRSPPIDREAVCAQIAAYYAEIVRSVDAIAREHGFPVFYLTTPTLARSHKPLTRWEASVASESPEMRDLTRRCGEVIDSTMAPRKGKVFFPLDALFDTDTTTVFLDDYGHVTERANGVIADRIVDLLVPVLQRSAGQ